MRSPNRRTTRFARRRRSRIGAVLATLASLSAICSSAQSPVTEPHATLTFSGSNTADLFTREIDASLAGVRDKDFVAVATPTEPAGFVNASPQGQAWYGTMWTRDAGTYLRELTLRGDFHQASLLARCLMSLVAKNDAGYFFFPRFFRGNKPGSGTELDGTSAVVIGLTLLWQRLPANDPSRAEIQTFLLGDASPIAYIRVLLSQHPLLAGSGEFGCGMGVQGECDNVVQNNLVRLALESVSRMEASIANPHAVGDHALAESLRHSMEEHLVAPDGAWIWTVNSTTFAADPKVLGAKANLGFGGTDGVLSMTADVLGLQPAITDPTLVAHSQQTFNDLLDEPRRKEQFDRFGIFTQFDAIGGGVLTSPSYGQGYALQDALLTDDLTTAGRLMDWLATATYQPIPEYHLTRSSPYFFYERYYSPEAPGKVDLAVGCGALNLVNVTEPLKVSRLILGVDDSNPAATLLLPRILPGWQRMQAHDWPILTSRGVVRVNLDYQRRGAGAGLKLQVLHGAHLDRLTVRLPSAAGFVTREWTNVRSASFTTH